MRAHKYMHQVRAFVPSCKEFIHCMTHYAAGGVAHRKHVWEDRDGSHAFSALTMPP